MKAISLVLAGATIAITLAGSMPGIADEPGSHAPGRIKHVLLISIDGMRAVDFYNCTHGIAGANSGDPCCPNVASLARRETNYVATSSSKPSDSFPGLAALVTGGSPKTTGIYYDVAYDCSLDAPTITTGARQHVLVIGLLGLHVALVDIAVQFQIGLEAIGSHCAAGFYRCVYEAMQGCSRQIRDRLQPDTAWTNHRATQLMQHRPSCLVVPQARHALETKSADAVLLAGKLPDGDQSVRSIDADVPPQMSKRAQLLHSQQRRLEFKSL
jgi:hypothetical protein